jgi:hypothetical protein
MTARIMLDAVPEKNVLATTVRRLRPLLCFLLSFATLLARYRCLWNALCVQHGVSPHCILKILAASQGVWGLGRPLLCCPAELMGIVTQFGLSNESRPVLEVPLGLDRSGQQLHNMGVLEPV